jgi:hypothetical protein
LEEDDGEDEVFQDAEEGYLAVLAEAGESDVDMYLAAEEDHGPGDEESSGWSSASTRSVASRADSSHSQVDEV